MIDRYNIKDVFIYAKHLICIDTVQSGYNGLYITPL